MPIDYAALKTELALPAYAAALAAGNHVTVAALLNEVKPAISIQRDFIPAHDVFEAISQAEYTALTAIQLQRLHGILSMGPVNVKGPNTKATFQSIFGAGGATRTALTALINRPGSRAEELFGVNTKVTPADIAQALVS